MKTFSGVSLLISAQFLALSALVPSVIMAVSYFSTAAHSSERHAFVIAGERASAISALASSDTCPSADRSRLPAEVC